MIRDDQPSSRWWPSQFPASEDPEQDAGIPIHLEDTLINKVSKKAAQACLLSRVDSRDINLKSKEKKIWQGNLHGKTSNITDNGLL